MKFNVFNTNKNDAQIEPMFFGNPVNVSRYDRQKYSFFDKQHKAALGYYWIPEEIKLDQDSYDFKNHMDTSAQHIFTSNLKYQILLDSVQGRAPSVALLPYTSLPELENIIQQWAYYETIHSRSYTHIIRGVYNKPGEVLDTILDIQEIIDRASVVTKYYDDFIEYGSIYNLYGYGKHKVNGKIYDINEKELKRKMYLQLVAINILEGLRFYVSFACTWAFSETSHIMNKSAKILQLICRDENLHLAITTFILKKLANGDEGDIFARVAEECKQEVVEMFRNAVTQETAWADYLFQHGSIVGLNAEILTQYVQFMANKRLRTLGFAQEYSVPMNPLPWAEYWISDKANQPAPQETEKTGYIVGNVKMDISSDTFKNIKL